MFRYLNLLVRPLALTSILFTSVTARSGVTGSTTIPASHSRSQVQQTASLPYPKHPLAKRSVKSFGCPNNDCPEIGRITTNYSLQLYYSSSTGGTMGGDLLIAWHDNTGNGSAFVECINTEYGACAVATCDANDPDCHAVVAVHTGYPKDGMNCESSPMTIGDNLNLVNGHPGTNADINTIVINSGAPYDERGTLAIDTLRLGWEYHDKLNGGYFFSANPGATPQGTIAIKILFLSLGLGSPTGTDPHFIGITFMNLGSNKVANQCWQNGEHMSNSSAGSATQTGGHTS